jgi:dihydroxy-acid dehydratase
MQANTMACAIEALGMSLPYSSSSPADSVVKSRECDVEAGAALRVLLELNLRPRDIMTRAAFGERMDQIVHPLCLSNDSLFS